jgi:hypothetical protein
MHRLPVLLVMVVPRTFDRSIPGYVMDARQGIIDSQSAICIQERGRPRSSQLMRGWIFCARSLRKLASGLKSWTGFPVRAVWHPPSAQVEGPQIRPRDFGARYFKPEGVFRSERAQKIQPCRAAPNSVRILMPCGAAAGRPSLSVEAQRPDGRAVKSDLISRGGHGGDASNQ